MTISPNGPRISTINTIVRRISTMIGCVFPVLLLLIGGVLGGVLGGTSGEVWGGSIGFLLGVVLFAVLLGVLARSRHR
jgi:hypothetical protein